MIFFSDTYPREIPQIMIQSKLMHEGQAEELKSFLNKKSKTMTGKNMIKTLYEEARKWITEQGKTFPPCILYI